MTSKSAALQGGLAVLGLALAYTTSQREAERSPGDIVLVDATQKELASVRLENEKVWSELRRGEQDGESILVVQTSASPDGKLPERERRASEMANKLAQSFTPLRAVRALGKPDAAKLKELGISESKKRLIVTVRGEKRSFVVSAGGGGGAPYLKDERDGSVYLLGPAVLNDFDDPQRLVDRQLHSFLPMEYDGLTVTFHGTKRDLVQTNPDNPGGSHLASKKSPDKADEPAKVWHEKIFRLGVSEVLGKGEQPKSGTPEVALRVDYTWRGKAVGWLELAQVTPPSDGTSKDKNPPQPELYARTEHALGWVRVTGMGNDLFREAEKVVAAE